MANSWPKWRRRAEHIQDRLTSGATIEELANEYDVSPKSIENRLGELKGDGLIVFPENWSRRMVDVDKCEADSSEVPIDDEIKQEMKRYKTTIDITADGSHRSDRLLRMSEEQSKDVDYLLAAHGYDKDAWELVSARSNIWHVYSKVDGIQTLYASKITVKPKENKYTDDDMMRFFEQLASTYQSPVHNPTNYKSNGKLLELNIADLHLGKLAWAGDSGDTYNHEIARERFFYIINDVITRTQSFGFERILFVWCNDFYHFDGPSKTTTNGTPQDASLQYEQMFELGCEMLVQAIDLLSQIAPVTTMYVASNHDRHVSYFATKYLSAWYRNNPNIKIDSRALSRKAVRFGKCLIGFTHGDKEKKRIKEWMQVEYAPDWGETIYREVHAAHIHSERSIEEDGGQIIRYVSSPTGTDKWHNNGAYIGAIQKGQAFIWDRMNGLEDTKNTVVQIGDSRPETIVV